MGRPSDIIFFAADSGDVGTNLAPNIYCVPPDLWSGTQCSPTVHLISVLVVNVGMLLHLGCCLRFHRKNDDFDSFYDLQDAYYNNDNIQNDDNDVCKL